MNQIWQVTTSGDFSHVIINKKQEYIGTLLISLQKRFLPDKTTYELCITLEGLLDFTWLAYPCKTEQCSNTDLDSLNLHQTVINYDNYNVIS